MTLQWLVATFHLLAFGIGLGAVWVRAMSLGGIIDTNALQRAFRADVLWGLSVLVWISTGLLRVFGRLEKGSAYYMQNDMFWVKMALLLAVLLLEVWPMFTLIQWRVRLARGEIVNTSSATAFARISVLQALLIIGMAFAATGMARGYGAAG